MLNSMTNSETRSAVPRRALHLRNAKPADRIGAGPQDEDVHRPMKGILFGVLLGAACWAAVIGALIAW